MTTQEEVPVVEGFLLLPRPASPLYQGVDRNPFHPTLPVSPNYSVSAPSSHLPAISQFYEEGWKRDAYHIYEQSVLQEPESYEEVWILKHIEAATEINNIISPYLGKHDLVACKLWDLHRFPKNVLIQEPSLGYDVAYPGGNYYSAVKNGLIYKNPSALLIRHYGQLLNNHGLFSNTKFIDDYMHSFRAVVTSEKNSTFCLYWLDLMN